MLRYIALFLVVACGNKTDKETADPTTAADTDTDTDTDTDSDTDTDADTDTYTGDSPASDIRAELDKEYGTVIRVIWDQGANGTAFVEFRYNGRPWQASPTQKVDVGAQGAWILGVPYEVEVEYRIISDVGKGNTASTIQTIDTAPWPTTLPTPIVLTSVPETWDPEDRYVLTSMNQEGDDRYGDWWTFIMDREGQVLWARFTDTNYISRYVRIPRSGEGILVDHNSAWPQGDAGEDSYIIRMTLDGQTLETFDTPGLHHSFVDMPEGEVVWLALQGSYSNERLEMVAPDGSGRTIWDCEINYIDYYKIPTTSCGTNGLFWWPDSDTFLVSSWAIDTVIEVDRQTGQTMRWFGQIERSWAFDPPDSEFDWQHGPIYTDDGNMMVSSRRYDTKLDRYETVVYEYELDEATETLQEVWSFGKGFGIYGAYMGEVHRLDNGNTLHNYGEEARLREVQPDGTMIWEVWWEGDKHIGRSTYFSDMYDYVLPDNPAPDTEDPKKDTAEPGKDTGK